MADYIKRIDFNILSDTSERDARKIRKVWRILTKRQNDITVDDFANVVLWDNRSASKVRFPKLTLEVKKRVAFSLRNTGSLKVSQWGLQFFDFHMLLLLLEVYEFNASDVKFLLKNSNFDQYLVDAFFTRAHIMDEFNTELLRVMPEHFWTQDLIVKLVRWAEPRGGIEIIYTKARAMFDIDKGIPNSWVVRILQ